MATGRKIRNQGMVLIRVPRRGSGRDLRRIPDRRRQILRTLSKNSVFASIITGHRVLIIVFPSHPREYMNTRDALRLNINPAVLDASSISHVFTLCASHFLIAFSQAIASSAVGDSS